MDTLFVKGYCKKTSQFYNIEVYKTGGDYKVVNMTLLDPSKARLLTTQIKQDKFYTSQNLIPCKKCGNRLVGGCSCPETYFNCEKNEYNFSCIYCKNFSIDYSTAKVSASDAGKKVTLEQGKEVEITFSNVTWKHFDNVQDHPDGSKFDEPKVHVEYSDKNIKFVGYNISHMEEGVKYSFGKNDSFMIDCYIDTSKIKPHPNGRLHIDLGYISAVIGKDKGMFWMNKKKVCDVDNKFQMKLVVKGGKIFEIYIDNKLVKEYVRNTETLVDNYNPYIAFWFEHKKHNCELLSYASITNINMRLTKGQ